MKNSDILFLKDLTVGVLDLHSLQVSFLLRDDLFIIPSLKSCLRNQLTSTLS